MEDPPHSGTSSRQVITEWNSQKREGLSRYMLTFRATCSNESNARL
jgi:hypothetical protein